MLHLRITIGSALAAFLLPVATFAASGDTMTTTTSSGSTSTGGTLIIAPTSTGSTTTGATMMEEEMDDEVTTIMDREEIDLPDLPSVSSGAALTRAELTARVVAMLYEDAEIDHCFWDIASSLPPTFTLVYTDVPVTSPYAKYICIAMRDGIVHGFKDGTFIPNRKVNLAEAGTIISRAFAFAPFAQSNTGAWYWPYVESLSVRNVIPSGLSALSDVVTEQDLEEMMNRIMDQVTWLPSTTIGELVSHPAPTAPAAQTPVDTNAASSSAASSPAASSPKTTTSSVSSKAPEVDEDSSVSSNASVPEEDEDKAWWNPF